MGEPQSALSAASSKRQKSNTRVVRSLTNDDNSRPQKKGTFFKRLEHKINKQRPHMVAEIDDLPFAQQRQALDVMEYKDSLTNVMKAFYEMMERDPAYRCQVYSDKMKEAPPKMHTFERAAPKIRLIEKEWKGEESAVEQLVSITKECAKHQREFQIKGWKAFADTRRFLIHELKEVERVKLELKNDKDHLDITTAEIPKKPEKKYDMIEAKAKLDGTIEQWEACLKQVVEDHKPSHKADLIRVLHEAESYHRAMASAYAKSKTIKFEKHKEEEKHEEKKKKKK